jgi:DNA polymerase III subunit delta'
MTPFPWHADTLRRLLALGERMPHALLVQGPAGIGKAVFARALAASVLCEAPQADRLACGRCKSCLWFSQGNHPDFREVIPEAAAEEEGDAADDAAPAKAEKAKSLVIKIEQVRDIGDFVTLTTHRGGYRVLVIRPAEAMQPAAANALLKTLEEPPPHTLIVLVSDRPARLLPTIRSRCRALVLEKPAREAALAWLREESVQAPDAALAAAGGAPLLARDLARPEEAELRRRVVAELSRPSGADPLQFASAVDREAVERFLYWMQTWVQDLLRVRLAGGPRYHAEHAAALRARARGAHVERLLDLDRELTEARRLATHPLNPRLLAEHLLMTYNQATTEIPR